MNKKFIPLVFVSSFAFAQAPVVPMGADANVDEGLDKPVRVVDSKGVTLGRFVGAPNQPIVLLTYKGQAMAVPLGDDLTAEGLPASGGFTWATTQFYYFSADCSGPAYVANGVVFGTRYVGWTRRVNGKVYINVADVKLSATRSFNSVYDGQSSACTFLQRDGWLAPIVASIVVDPPAKPPLFLK